MNLLATFRGSSSPSSRSSHSLSKEGCRIVFIFAKFFKNILCFTDSKIVILKDQVSTFHTPLLWDLEQLCHKVTKNKPLLPAEKDYTYIARNLLLRCSRVMTILQKYVVSRYSYIDDKICLFPAFFRLIRACLRQLVSPGAFCLGCQQY